VGASKNVIVNDALIRSMIWMLVMWLVAGWSGFFARRRNALRALLPQVFLLAAIISYSENRIESLWLIVLMMLLLMGIWNYRNHTIQWEQHRVDYSDSIRYDNTEAVLLLAISIGMLAFITPSISWRQIRDYLKNGNQANQAAEMLGIEQQKVPVKNTFVQTPALPREHLLTEGFEQSQQIVMTVNTGELPALPTSALARDAPRYYWRSTVYDDYVGAGWVTSTAAAQSYKANSPLLQGLLEGYRPLHLNVELKQPQGVLIWSGILSSADIPIRVHWRVRPVSNPFADQTALLQADVFHVATTATEYKVDALLPSVTVEELRKTSTGYPEYIRNRYLKLPPELPARVHQLASDIVKGIDHPYEKAKAIESYLRTNYPYDLNIPMPPKNQDVADYFLFDLRKGYCDYYATAMVVLARSSGLPARFVSGYASGTYDAPTAQYVVRALDAHSWPEIYFPEIGWVEFEPTGSQPEIERPERESEGLSPPGSVTPASRFLFQFTRERVLFWLLPFAAVLLLTISYFAVFERILFLHLAPQVAIERLYRRLYRLGRPLTGGTIRSETALEFASKLIHAIQNITGKPLQTQHHIQRLTNIYYASLFSSAVIHAHDVQLAFKIWRGLRWSLRMIRLRHWFRNKGMPPSFKTT
jgi:transglutaminase-like putative cysteine protease